MFKENTLFILGAGASAPYGYPIGKDLIKNIIDNIENDVIYLPKVNTSTRYYYNDNNGKIENDVFKDGYKFSDFENLFKNAPLDHFLRANQVDEPHVDQHQYIKTRLNQITELYHLKKSLIDFDPTSIDSFLGQNPSHILAGKIMIIYSLLKFENKEKFTTSNKDNWYSYLITDILSGVTSSEEIFENNLEIITFNYSVDLDFCIKNKLSRTELLNNDLGKKFIGELEAKHIRHVYGKIRDDSCMENYGQFYHTKAENVYFRNMARFIQAVKSMNNIKVIKEERVRTEEYTNLITKSKNIIIIGFGFDRDNLDLLGFPNSKSQYTEFFSNKNVKYMDFEGKMRNLFGQFMEIIKLKETFRITCSKADKISDTYQNDFKLKLYD